MRESTTRVLYVADTIKGETRLLDAKELDDPIEGIHASAAVPLLYTEPVYIKGERLVDSISFPVKKILGETKPTCLLVFANRAKGSRDNMLIKIFFKIASIRNDDKIKQKMIEKEREFNESVAYLKKSGVPYVIIWTDSLVNSLTQNERHLRVAAERYRRYVYNLFKKS